MMARKEQTNRGQFAGRLPGPEYKEKFAGPTSSFTPFSFVFLAVGRTGLDFAAVTKALFISSDLTSGTLGLFRVDLRFSVADAIGSTSAFLFTMVPARRGLDSNKRLQGRKSE